VHVGVARLTQLEALDTIADQQTEIENRVVTIENQYGTKVHHVYDAEVFFPAHWIDPPISAQGQELPADEIWRLLPIIEQFLSRYPASVLNNNLADIFLLEELRFYGQSFGATNSNSGLYIKSEGNAAGFTDLFLQQRMHSEFSSILRRNYVFPEIMWRAVNADDFEYIGNGVELLGEANLYRTSPELLSQGFIVRYAQSSVENDFNMIAYHLFTDLNNLMQIASEYPLIKEKVDLAINFYESVDSRFDFR